MYLPIWCYNSSCMQINQHILPTHNFVMPAYLSNHVPIAILLQISPSGSPNQHQSLLMATSKFFFFSAYLLFYATILMNPYEGETQNSNSGGTRNKLDIAECVSHQQVARRCRSLRSKYRVYRKGTQKATL